ncbi:MAG: pentapeptide repeat-containing protein, partial [Thermoplasmata archaeon]|nr:pentapeptide repeat-containing protein [Thermoplasmata archaeon]
SKADCNGADFTKAHCNGANFRGTSLTNVSLDETWLRFVDLYKSKMEGSTIHYAYFGHNRDSTFVCEDFHNRAEETVEKIKKILKKLELKTPKTKEERKELRWKIGTYTDIMNKIQRMCYVGKNDRKKVLSRFEQARDVYLNLKNTFKTNGYYEQSGEYFICEREMNRALLKNKWKSWKESCEESNKDEKNKNRHYWKCINNYLRDRIKWLIQTLLFKIGAYGEKPFWIAGWGFFIVLIYGFIYLISDSIINTINGVSLENWYDASYYLYFSIVTFTTLGYGDMSPNGGMRLVASSEALIGALMIAYFVVALARKVMR